MIVPAVLGLILPGYLLARALRAPYCWAVAFPLSAVMLTNFVIVYTIFGIPLRFENVLAALVAISCICLVVWRWRKAIAAAVPKATLSSANQPPKSLVIVVGILIGLIMLGLSIRTSFFALTGYDTAIRWDLLPRLMLKHQGLSYYPPRTDDDFMVYPSFPDGFPPLVSTVYWWLYSALGKPWTPITSVPVVLQAVCCLALVFCAASNLFGRIGGLIAVAALASSAAFLAAVAIGQETGYTALCYAGQLTFTLAATRQPRAGTVVIAGMFAALGALSREYGPLLSVAGFSILACHPLTRRYLPLFCLVAGVLGGIWYVRNWVLTGNPVYPMDVLGLPSNRVFTEMLGTYREHLGIRFLAVKDWPDFALQFWLGAPLALLIGVPCLFVAGRNAFALGIAIAVIFLVWVLSTPYTAGGLKYSFRVLAPAYVALSIVAGAVGSWFFNSANNRPHWLRSIAILAILICGGYSALCCWAYPYLPTQLPLAAISTMIDPLDAQIADLKVAIQFRESDLQPTRVLTDSCYLAVALQRYTKFHPVLIWSPEVSFVFDREVSLAEVQNRLRAKNICLISSSDYSLNNLYLRQYPYFQEKQVRVRTIFRIPDAETIFMLYPADEPSTGSAGKTQP